ncbi:hypothetical protein Hypma_014406 [Hypsizygus marmoreus]|uniref:Uncharacterized protein n=1 Tax=Hypsizygus marmoreus TaxID=39966 RepID=A0A369JH61_HYPMA|nr:hypothetical protein Hypma_014406 [Hypsizygus marmoreus]
MLKLETLAHNIASSPCTTSKVIDSSPSSTPSHAAAYTTRAESFLLDMLLHLICYLTIQVLHVEPSYILKHLLSRDSHPLRLLLITTSHLTSRLLPCHILTHSIHLILSYYLRTRLRCLCSVRTM